MMSSSIGKPIGLLHTDQAHPKFSVSLYPPSDDLSAWIEHYWIVNWDLRGQEPYLQENVPHPSVHLVLEQGNSRLVGVVKGRFSILLQDQGAVFGIKFRPGGFYPLIQQPISTLTNRTIPFADWFGIESDVLENQIFAQENAEQMIKIAETFIRSLHPVIDPQLASIDRIVQAVLSNREITKVDHIVDLFSISKKQLQLLFDRYVGVSPKWMIQRYRLHEAVEKMTAQDIPDWSALAVELGYYDQAHFIKDFKAIIGKSPAQYTQSLSQ